MTHSFPTRRSSDLHVIAAWCGQAAGTAIALRPSNVYGPGQHGKGGFAIIPTAMGRIASGEPMVVWGDGSARRDYIFIADLIDVCRRILYRPMMHGFEIFNACRDRKSTRLNSCH